MQAMVRLWARDYWDSALERWLAVQSHHKRCMSLRHLFIMCRHRRQFITGPWSMVLHIITAITGTVTGDPLVVVA